MFPDLQTTQIEAARIANPYVLHFLMALYWLKIYPSESVIAGTFKVDEKTESERKSGSTFWPSKHSRNKR
jgi:hypothetical protein